MLHIEQPTTGVVRVFGFIVLGMLTLTLCAGAFAGLGDFPAWAYAVAMCFVGAVAALCAWGGTAIDVDPGARLVRVSPMLFGHTLRVFGRGTRIPQGASVYAEFRTVEDEGDAVIFHYVVIASAASKFDVKAYRDADEANDTATAIAEALGIATMAPVAPTR